MWSEKNLCFPKIMEDMTRRLRNTFIHSKLYLWKREYLGKAVTDGQTLIMHHFQKEKLDDRFDIYRGKEILKDRLDAGYTGYWFEYNNTFVHAHWYSSGQHDIWDTRCMLVIPPNALYIFDGYTSPEYRRKGFVTKALEASCSDMFSSNQGMLFCLTQPKNVLVTPALAKIGFKRYGEINMWQAPPFRYHIIQIGVHIQRHMRLMNLRNSPLPINLEKTSLS